MTPKKKANGEHFSDDERATAKARFLLQLAKNANIAAACRVAGVSRESAHQWKRDDRDFAARWDSAIEDACDKLEEIAFRRASGGTNPSDTLMIFLLKAHRPLKYREQQHVEHSGTITTRLRYVNDWRRPHVETIEEPLAQLPAAEAEDVHAERRSDG